MALSADVAEQSLLDACPAVRSASLVDGTWRLEVNDTHAAVSQIVSFTEKHGLRVSEIKTATTSLEDAFMTILKEDVEREILT